ncbi:MAG: hypothetical protein ACOCPT_03330, partial [Halanaeroarchaeum sp.]
SDQCMGRILVMGTVLVVLGAAVAMPGPVLATGDHHEGADAIEYSGISGGGDSPVLHSFAVNGDGTLSDRDEDDEEDDDDEEEEDEDDEDEDDEDDDDAEDEEDDEKEEEEEDDDDAEDEEDDEKEEEEEDDDDAEDEEDEDDDDRGTADDADTDTGTDDERMVAELIDEFVDAIPGGANATNATTDETEERPTTRSSSTSTHTPPTTRPPTETPTQSPTSTHSVTSTATETPGPAAFDISNTTVDRREIAPGETLRVDVQVANDGERTGTFEGNLLVDGEVVDTASSTIEGGAVDTITFEHRFESPGEYELAVETVDIGAVTVVQRTTERAETTGGVTTAPGRGAVQVVDAEIPADWVRVGARTTLRATVVNTADETADRTLTVRIDEDVVGNETVELQPSERREVSIEFVAAEGTLSVAGFEVGFVDVRGPENDSLTGTVENTTGPETDTARESILLVALLGLLLGGVGLFVVSRR